MRSSLRVIKSSSVLEEKCLIPVEKIILNEDADIISSDDMVAMIDKANEISRNIIESAELEKQQILADAIEQTQLEASEMLETLKKEAFNQAYTEGFQQGEKEGFQQGIQKALEQSELIEIESKEILEKAYSEAKAYVNKMEVDIIELSINIAERILKKSLANDYDVIYNTAKEIIMEFKNRKEITIRVNPSNMAYFQTHIDGLKAICPEATFAVLNDDSVDTTGCIIENENQVISTEISGQLENVKEALLQVRSNDGR